MIEVSRFWTSNEDILVQIELKNLHSDEEFGKVKYIHNTTKIVHVQYPVLDAFTYELLEFWLISDGI